MPRTLAMTAVAGSDHPLSKTAGSATPVDRVVRTHLFEFSHSWQETCGSNPAFDDYLELLVWQAKIVLYTNRRRRPWNRSQAEGLPYSNALYSGPVANEKTVHSIVCNQKPLGSRTVFLTASTMWSTNQGQDSFFLLATQPEFVRNRRSLSERPTRFHHNRHSVFARSFCSRMEGSPEEPTGSLSCT